MCNFQSYYFNNNGYVVRCKDCGNYKVAFLSTMLTLMPESYEALCLFVKNACASENVFFNDNAKNIVVPTPSKGIKLLLTRQELINFLTILDEADTEEKTLSILELFK